MSILAGPSFRSEFDKTFQSVFVRLPGGDLDFAHKEWESVLVPYGLYRLRKTDQIYLALANAALEQGDHEMIVTGTETEPPHQETIVSPWDPPEFDRLLAQTDIVHFDAAAFGRSATWGIICGFDDYLHIGGSPQFMESFTARAGGRRTIRQTFLWFADSEWQADERVKREMLDQVGWLGGASP
jgi:hypothetical protein